MELEDVKDGQNFMETARKAVAKKPVLVFKPGWSQAGARAAASHTSSLAGDDRVYEGAFKQAGILRANNWQEFWEIPRVFASQALPLGNRTAILSITGGGGIVAADTAAEAGLAIATFTDATVRKLAKLSPRLANNPVDYGPLTTVVDDPVAITEEIISLVLSDEAVDCGALMIYGGVDGTAEMLCRVTQNTPKPITLWLFGPVPSVTEELHYRLASRGLATYLDQETAIKALGMAAAYSRIKSGLAHQSNG